MLILPSEKSLSSTRQAEVDTWSSSSSAEAADKNDFFSAAENVCETVMSAHRTRRWDFHRN